MIRGSQWLQDYDMAQVIAAVQSSKGDDLFGYRGEFLQLVKLAEALK